MKYPEISKDNPWRNKSGHWVDENNPWMKNSPNLINPEITENREEKVMINRSRPYLGEDEYYADYYEIENEIARIVAENREYSFITGKIDIFSICDALSDYVLYEFNDSEVSMFFRMKALEEIHALKRDDIYLYMADGKSNYWNRPVCQRFRSFFKNGYYKAYIKAFCLSENTGYVILDGIRSLLKDMPDYPYL